MFRTRDDGRQQVHQQSQAARRRRAGTCHVNHGPATQALKVIVSHAVAPAHNSPLLELHGVDAGRAPAQAAYRAQGCVLPMCPPEPLFCLRRGHAAQVGISSLHFACLSLRHLFGDVVGVGMLRLHAWQSWCHASTAQLRVARSGAEPKHALPFPPCGAHPSQSCNQSRGQWGRLRLPAAGVPCPPCNNATPQLRCVPPRASMEPTLPYLKWVTNASVRLQGADCKDAPHWQAVWIATASAQTMTNRRAPNLHGLLHQPCCLLVALVRRQHLSSQPQLLYLHRRHGDAVVRTVRLAEPCHALATGPQPASPPPCPASRAAPARAASCGRRRRSRPPARRPPLQAARVALTTER